MKKSEKNVIAEYEEVQNGKTVTVTKFKAKDKKALPNARRSVSNCPNCLSSVKVNDVGIWECSSDRIKIWENEFIKFNELDDIKKKEYLLNMTSDSRFLDLYEVWHYAFTNNKPEEFTCGYTNKIFLPIAPMRSTMPDPVFVGQIENKLGRKLTDEEILGESELWFYQHRVLQKWRKGAKKVRIPIISIPEDV